MNSILDRDTALAQTLEIRELGRPVLRKVIDEAAGIFERSSQTAPDGDENLGILMPFHHAIEMLDGVEVLLDKSCVVASRTPLRSAFEASLAVRYVLDADTGRRALCYVVADIYQRLRWYEEHDPDTERGKQFRAEVELPEDLDFPMPDVESTRKAAASLRSMLADGAYPPIANEYEEVSKKRRGRTPWYSLFAGPGNLRELARAVGDLDDYLILYRTWSNTAHATDLNRQLTKVQDGSGPAVGVVRSPMGMPHTYVLAIYIGVEVTRAVLEHYRPGEAERFAEWYLEQISPVSEKLSSIKEEVASL